MERSIVKFPRFTEEINYDKSKPIIDKLPIRTRIFVRLLNLLKKSYKIKSKYIENLQTTLNQNIAQLQNINQDYVKLTFETFTEVISNINFCTRDLTMLLELGTETSSADDAILKSLESPDSQSRFSKISFNASNLQDRIDGIPTLKVKEEQLPKH